MCLDISRCHDHNRIRICQDNDCFKLIKNNYPWFLLISNYVKIKSKTRGDLSLFCQSLSSIILTIDDFHNYSYVIYFGIFHGLCKTKEQMDLLENDFMMEDYLTQKVKILKKIAKHYFQIKGRMFPEFGFYEPTKRKHNQI